jgi:hypothetical protein
LREGKKLLFIVIFIRVSRDMKSALEMGISLHRGPVGDLEEVRLPGLFAKKRRIISGFLSWTQRT